ncbi:MAG: GNAT family N-acetyltransferase [Desulfovibrio sp.]|nr:GNAT family N-acetyltransferase [Desulfovibrio sp.]
MNMHVRRAGEKDIPSLISLLTQVNRVHHEGRPDLFKCVTKYSADDLMALLRESNFPVFVAEHADGRILGHAFCQVITHKGERLLCDIKTLYIDDICVDENARRMHVGQSLYAAVLDYARQLGCYNVTLNVWACNPDAHAFYTKMGLRPQKYGLETIL